MSPRSGRPEAMFSSATRRWVLWGVLVTLVAALLVTLVWLARRHEASVLQDRIERDAADIGNEIRLALARNVQALQALAPVDAAYTGDWSQRAAGLLRGHRELLRVEWRDAGMQLVAAADSGFRLPLFAPQARDEVLPAVRNLCAGARRAVGPMYAPSRFVAQQDGVGVEVLEVCIPVPGKPDAYMLAVYALGDILTEMVGESYARAYDVAFTDNDGTRRAFHGAERSGNRTFTASQPLQLAGFTMQLRLDSWRGTPALFPNFLTAMVVAMALGLVTVLVLLVRDARRRQRVEHELADALAFRKAMEDSLVTGLRARDLQGNTTYVNPAFCAMVGFSAQELLSAGNTAPYWPPELRDEYQERQAGRLAGAQPPREGFESVFMRKDGSRFPVLVIEAPLIDAQGVQSGWMTAFVDISEQRRVEEISRASLERLQATARLATLGEMASSLSHELNQPLAAISSYATGSINMLRAPSAQAGAGDVARGLPPGLGADSVRLLDEGLRHIAEQAQRAGKVIKSVHDFVRRRERAHEAVAPRAVLDAIMPLVQLQARKLGVRVRMRVEDDLPDVVCDRTMVEQVLLNLARNAMQAMAEVPESTRLLVLLVRRAQTSDRTAHHVGWLEFHVVDAGTGIAPEVAEKLFTPFFTTKNEGMGLGLSLCRTVVEQHGGFLAFGPNSPQGTAFRFTLPIAPAPAAGGAAR